jgi:acetyltransferase-like isoleucine patch superfamily enzyme
VIRDHRPYFVKRAYLRLQQGYTRRILRPQFAALGRHPSFIKPWHIEIFGSPIEMGDYGTIFAISDAKVRLSVWPAGKGKGRIRIGNFCMLCPGVRIGSAAEVVIEDSCMIASHAYITDCDWHDVYDRVSMGKSDPIRIEPNVWIGDSAIICKGVHLGTNSIVGAGAVVVDDIPANTIAAGNPARVVKTLDPQRPITTRKDWYADPASLFSDIERLDKEMLRGNTLRRWIRSLLFPSRGD